MSIRLFSSAPELTGLSEGAMKTRTFILTVAAYNGNTKKRVYQKTEYTVVGDADDDLLEEGATVAAMILSLSDGVPVSWCEKLGIYRFDEELVDIGGDRRYGSFFLDTVSCDRAPKVFIPFVKETVSKSDIETAMSSLVSGVDPTASVLGCVTWNDRDNPTAIRTHCAEAVYGAKISIFDEKVRDPISGFTDVLGVSDHHLGDATS